MHRPVVPWGLLISGGSGKSVHKRIAPPLSPLSHQPTFPENLFNSLVFPYFSALSTGKTAACCGWQAQKQAVGLLSSPFCTLP